MRFHLTYEGKVLPHKRGISNHKMELRKAFHVQLKRLWQTEPRLVDAVRDPTQKENERLGDADGGGAASTNVPLIELLASRHTKHGYRFVPLVHNADYLQCRLKILMLRSSGSSGRLSAGDLDNRTKTIIDALRLPKTTHELGDFPSPDTNENPFFVLLEDDDLVTNISVDTNDLLRPVATTELEDRSMCLVIIRVDVTAYKRTIDNLALL